MTMQVTIKNADATRVLKVTEQTFTIGQALPYAERYDKLASGEVRTYHVHAAKRLVITEDAEALVPKEAR